MPMCRLFQLNLHEAGDIILRTPRRASFSPQLTYMQGDVTQLEPFAISPDGSRIACHRYSEIHVGKTASGEMERVPLRLEPSTDVPFLRFCGLHFSKNGRQLLSANTLGDIHIMELDGMEDSWIHLPPAENLDPTLDWHAAFSPAGDHCVFVSGHSPNLPLSVPPPPGSRSRILLRRVQANSDYQLLYATAEDFPSSKAVFTSDAQYVVQAYGHYIVVCDIALGALHVKITPNDTSSGFCHDITTLAAVSNTICASMALDGTVILWDLNQGSYVHTLCKGSDELPRLLTLACSLDGLVLGIVADGIVRSVSTTDGHTIAEHLFPYHQTRNGYTEVPAVVLDVNHSRVYVAAMAEPLFFWSFKKILEPPHASITSSSAVRQMRFSADDQLLMSCTTNSSMTIWQTSTGLRSAECNGKGETLFAALSIPIPRYVISTGIIYEALDAGLRSFFQVNDTKTGKLLRRAHLSSHDSSPILDQFTLSADGRLLVLRLFFRGPHVEDNTGALFILSAYTFAILAQSPDLGSASCKLQYTPDGRTLVQMWPYEGLIVVIDGKNLKVRHTLHFENCSESDDWIVSSCSNRLGRLCSHHANPGRLIVEVWDLGTGLREATAFQLHYDGDENILFQVKAHIWTPTRFLCATSVGIFSDINSVDTQVSHVFHPWPVLWGGPPQAICTSQDQLHIYAWCGDGILRGWATDDFHMERPIIQLATSAFEWPDMPEEYIVVRLALWIAPLNPTCLRAIVRVNMCHSLCLTIDMELERCVNIVFLGDEVNWTLPSGASTEDRLYILQRDPYACLSRLLHIPVSKDDDDDSWLQEADQYSRIFERQVLLHVLDPHTGEINTFLTWCEDSVKLEVIPASSALCKLRYDTRYQKRISSMYNAIDGWLKVYLGQRLLARLYIPPDRRPEGSILPDERFGGLATCDGFVALGSSQGVVSIFDIEKAVKAAKAGEPR
jgi:WD40 repeat protein